MHSLKLKIEGVLFFGDETDFFRIFAFCLEWRNEQYPYSYS